ncbi:response regulator transcription factor [Nonomuraea turkmeniaca]|nr:LuxR C-terminal-related transcriptional regulator [Nonomuraea turkmeniaca]
MSALTKAVKILIVTTTGRRAARARRLACLDELTEREGKVLVCLFRGMSNAEIATTLFLSETTVKGHISRILAKTQCTNRTQAGLLAYEAGLGR